MDRTSITDVLAFLAEPHWSTAIIWALIAASVAIAIRVAMNDPSQRTLGCAGDFVAFAFTLHPPGRSLGLDVLLHSRSGETSRRQILARLAI